MALVLIDSRRLWLIIIAMVVALALAFGAGYFTGSRPAETALVATISESVPSLPDAEQSEITSGVVAESEASKSVPETARTRATVTAKSAVTDSPVATLKKSAPIPPPAPKKSAPTPPPAPIKVIPAPAARPSVKLQPTETRAVDTVEPAATAPAQTQFDEQTPPALADTSNSEDDRYTIQTGIYGSLNNAERQVETLTGQNLQAYYEPYQNQNDETRYRVRFGYFASRTSASDALQQWQRLYADANGYLVRLQN